MMGSQEGESVAVTVSSIKPRDKAGSSEVILNPAEEERRRVRAFPCEGHREGEVGSRSQAGQETPQISVEKHSREREEGGEGVESRFWSQIWRGQNPGERNDPYTP